MREDHSEFKAGYIRLHVTKTERTKKLTDHGFEVLECDHISYGLSKPEGRFALDCELHGMGADYLLEESVNAIIKDYAVGDSIEIVGDVVLEYWKSWTDCGYEHDSAAWIDNEKHRKLTAQEVADIEATDE